MFTARNCLLSTVLLAAAAAAQQGGDLQAQILYAYQVEDTNSLSNLIQNLRTQIADNADDAALHYHLAHAEYRMGWSPPAGMRAAPTPPLTAASTS